jgi:helix-turn-helix protein
MLQDLSITLDQLTLLQLNFRVLKLRQHSLQIIVTLLMLEIALHLINLLKDLFQEIKIKEANLVLDSLETDHQHFQCKLFQSNKVLEQPQPNFLHQP